MKLSKIHLAILALIVTNIIWGAAFPIYKWSLENVEPFTFVFLRFFVAALIILPLTGNELKIQKKDYGILTALSLTGVSLTVCFWFMGLLLAPSINAPIIGASGPVMMLFFSWFFLRERLKTKTIIGTVISLIGVLFIVIQPVLQNTGGGSLLGNVFFLLATISGITHSLLLKKVTQKYSFMAVTFWSFLIGSIALLPLALYETYSKGFLEGLTYQGLIGIWYGAVFSSAAAYALLAFGMKYLKANETGIFAYIDPIVTALVAYPLLGETITSTYLLGAFLVFLGISISEGKLPMHPFHKIR